MATARIENYNGEPALVIDGKPYPPFTYCAINHSSGRITTDEEFVHQAILRYQTGERMFYLGWGATDWRDPDTDTRMSVDEILRRCKLVLDNVPGDDVYLGIGFDLNPPKSWIEAHPEELLKYSDGTSHPMIISGIGEVPGMYSICSEVYRKDAGEQLEKFMSKVDKAPFADKIVAVLISGGGTSEWYYPEGNEFTEYQTGTYADFSEPFRINFGKFLKQKYGDEETLKRVWKDESATFENPKIPDMEDRAYINIDETILDAMATYESYDRQIGKTINMDGITGTNLGIFLNANTCQHVADFYQAINYGTAMTLSHFGAIVKAHTPRRLVVTFYGALGCTNYFNFGTSSATLELIDSGNVDMLCSAASYNNREPGGYVAGRMIQDSLLLRNAMYSNEGDSRSHYTRPFYRDLMRYYDVKDTVNIFKREFGQIITENSQGWWYNMDPDFVNDGIYELLKRIKEIAHFDHAQDRRRNHEIALIYDLESLHYVSNDTDAMMLEFYRVSDLGRIGAPVDYYYHNDMARPDMPDYKMYIMVNCYCLTDEEREAIKAKARKNNALVLWLYAPGFINTDAGDIMSNDNIEAVTGMKVRRVDKTMSPRFKVTNLEHPSMKYADPYQFYGYIDRDIHSCIWPGSIYAPPKVKAQPPAFANPGFIIEEQDDITVLGRYCMDKEIAMAMKEEDGYTSVYCATQVVRSEILQSLAEYAGVHLYTRNDDFLCANETLVSVHARTTGKRTVYFKQPCSPFEVYEKKFYGHDVTEIEVDMYMGQTLTFSVRGEC